MTHFTKLKQKKKKFFKDNENISIYFLLSNF